MQLSVTDIELDGNMYNYLTKVYSFTSDSTNIAWLSQVVTCSTIWHIYNKMNDKYNQEFIIYIYIFLYIYYELLVQCIFFLQLRHSLFNNKNY